MPNLQDKTTRSILGKSLIVATSITLDFIADMLRRIDFEPQQVDQRNNWQNEFTSELIELERTIAEHFAITQWTAWTAGADWMSKLFPSWLVREFETGVRTPFDIQPPKPPGRFGRFFMDDDDPEQPIRFPKIEKAAESLQRRGIVTRDQFDLLSDDIKQQSFTIAGDMREDAIRSVREVLAENVDRGTSLQGFKNALGESLEGSFIGPAHLETVYRTNVQAAFRDGRESIANNPIVNAAFPYQEYLPIGDDRVREDHLALGSLGLDGTGVYRRDDPFWDRFTPPWDFNCRCGVNLLTLDKAASKGVKEAQRWLESGRPPEKPEYRYQDIPFRPKSGFGARQGVLAT